MSSLSDGIFVLHMPSEDRKQKVRLELSAVAYLTALSLMNPLNSALPPD